MNVGIVGAVQRVDGLLAGAVLGQRITQVFPGRGRSERPVAAVELAHCLLKQIKVAVEKPLSVSSDPGEHGDLRAARRELSGRGCGQSGGAVVTCPQGHAHDLR
jgi:hypothetical protein